MTQQSVRAFKPKAGGYGDDGNDDKQQEYTDEWGSYFADSRGNKAEKQKTGGFFESLKSPKAAAIQRSLGPEDY